MTTAISKTILLTGAGFSANFGGYLAEEMWSIIFNHPEVQKHPAVREFMLSPIGKYNYESIYHKVVREQGSYRLSGTFEPWDKHDIAAMKIAMSDAYKKLDRIMVTENMRTYRKDDLILLNKFINRFSRDLSEINFFFTLNQDLFIERYHSQSSTDSKQVVLPGFKKRVPEISDSFKGEREFNDSDFVKTPDDEELVMTTPTEFDRSCHHYVKLHGSFNWQAPDGSGAMIIGHEKEEQIKNEPILSWYFQIFEEVLSQAGMKLMVIGYGFRDDHVNKIIKNAITNYGVKLYVISPESPSEFIFKLKKPGERDIIVYKGLAGYNPSSFLDALKKTGDIFDDYFL